MLILSTLILILIQLNLTPHFFQKS